MTWSKTISAGMAFVVAYCFLVQTVGIHGLGARMMPTATAFAATSADVLRGWSHGMRLGHRSGLRNQAYQITYITALTKPHQFRVVGKLRAFEAIGSTKLTEDNGTVVQQPGSHADGAVAIHASRGAPAWGDFHVDYQYPSVLSRKVVVLAFYVVSPKDGEKQQDLRLRVQLP